MQNKISKTTQLTKPKPPQKRYAPQTPDNNHPDLGRATPTPTKSVKKVKR